MKVGIYNKYLYTIGGGEKYSATIAEILSRNNDVDFITHRFIDKNLLEARLNVDLKSVNIRFLPEFYDDIQVSKITHEYDLFINSTYLSTMPSLAKKSLLLVFFPLKSNIKYKLWKFLGELINDIEYSNIEYISGFYPLELHTFLNRWRWTADCAIFKIFMVNNNKPKNLIISLGSFRPDKVKNPDVSIFINDKKISSLTLSKKGMHKYKFEIPIEFVNLNYINVKLITETFKPSELNGSTDIRNLGIAVGRISLDDLNFFNKLIKYSRYLYNSLKCIKKDYLKTYTLICAISEYTQKWIKKYWNINSEVLYPPIDTEFFKPHKKENIIISVGRFFEGSHNKKHIPMIQAFKSMCDNGLKGWEYHLVGSTHSEKHHQNYLEKVKREGKGYPVFIHPDIPFRDIQKLYGEAKIFWHATGLGEDEKKDPGNFEHFGITTVEAMSAGCVPVVIGMAGQLEIIDDGYNGFLWKNLDELKEKTKKVIEDEELLEKLRINSLKTCEKFNKINFEKKLMEIINRNKVK